MWILIGIIYVIGIIVAGYICHMTRYGISEGDYIDTDHTIAVIISLLWLPMIMIAGIGCVIKKLYSFLDKIIFKDK